MKKKNTESRGQTLVEIVIALAIISAVVTAMTIVVTTALKNETLSKNQDLATQYAQEGMEIVKQMQVTDYQTFSTLSGRYCLAQSCSSLTTSGICGANSSGTNTNCPANVYNNFFIRQVDLLSAGAAQSKCVNTIQAAVSTLWTDGACQSGVYCHSQQIISCFSNAHVLTAP